MIIAFGWLAASLRSSQQMTSLETYAGMLAAECKNASHENIALIFDILPRGDTLVIITP